MASKTPTTKYIFLKNSISPSAATEGFTHYCTDCRVRLPTNPENNSEPENRSLETSLLETYNISFAICPRRRSKLMLLIHRRLPIPHSNQKWLRCLCPCSVLDCSPLPTTAVVLLIGILT